MNNKPTFEKTFEADSINLLNFTGDLELIAHDENTIKVEIYASVRSIFTFISTVILSWNLTLIHTICVLNNRAILSVFMLNHDTLMCSTGLIFKVLFSNLYSHSFEFQTKTFGGDVSLKGIGGNHFFETWGGKFWHKTPLVTSKEKRWVAKSN
jgi:hypothetical protein